MAIGLLFDADEHVANAIFAVYQRSHKYDKAIGIVLGTDLIGAVLFHNWNGFHVEMSYFGKGTVTAGIVRCLARYIICTFDPARLTVLTSKRNRRLIRSLQRLGFKLEGAQRCYYGKRDCVKNTALRFVVFRDRIEQIAALGKGTRAA